MEENKDEEHLDSASNIQSENLSEDTTSVQENETINPNQATENMEVHHHPDLHHKPKKWKEYILEFLMIFLAVTMGFFAESYREHLVEHKKEKEYIKSMVEDLQYDSSFLAVSINQRIPYHINWMDSTIHLLQSSNLNGKDREVYQAFFLATSWTYNYHPNERTLSQLHSEGFHLIKNENVVKALSLLEAQSNLNTTASPFFYDMQNDLDASNYTFADRNITDKIGQIAFQNYYKDYSAQLKLSDVPQESRINTANKEDIQSYIKKLQRYANYVQTAIKGQDISILRSITSTIAILKKEYTLK